VTEPVTEPPAPRTGPFSAIERFFGTIFRPIGALLRPLYNWIMGQADKRHAPWIMCAMAVLEASIFPILPDLMLWPIVLKRPDRAYLYAFMCTVASVVGGLLGYAIGFYLQDFARDVLIFFGHSAAELTGFQQWFQSNGPWVILAKGLTPIPFQVVTIVAGLSKLNIWAFIASALVIRSFRFFVTAFVLQRFGPAMLKLIEKRMAEFAILVIAIVVGGYFLLHYVQPH
jgi:membrane protein YqaA with SNARE-associated domain